MGRGGDATIGRLTWIAPDGSIEALDAASGDFGQFQISPDGRLVALPIHRESGNDIWLYDVPRSAITRLTFEGSCAFPVWSLDGESLFYRSRTGAEPHLRRRSIRDPEVVENLPTSQWFYPYCLSSDGRVLVAASASHSKIWLLSMSADDSGAVRVLRERAFMDSEERAYFPALSPDDRWLAYTSDETGSWEVNLPGLTGGSLP